MQRAAHDCGDHCLLVEEVFEHKGQESGSLDSWIRLCIRRMLGPGGDAQTKAADDPAAAVGGPSEPMNMRQQD